MGEERRGACAPAADDPTLVNRLDGFGERGEAAWERSDAAHARPPPEPPPAGYELHVETLVVNRDDAPLDPVEPPLLRRIRWEAQVLLGPAVGSG